MKLFKHILIEIVKKKKKKSKKNQCITSTEFKNKEYLVKKNAANVM